jgi:hypothetical protein
VGPPRHRPRRRRRRLLSPDPLHRCAPAPLAFPRLTQRKASGLYYLSELVEEHTVAAKKALTRLIYGIVALHALLWLLDGFPLRLALLSIASHAVYAQNLRRFPIVKLTDPVFLLSIGMSLR